MDLRTIRTFRTVVKHGSFHKAAEELSYAQSTVTMQIKRLEELLGTRLLERGKQKLQLTEAGYLLHSKGEYLLKEFERLEEAMYDLTSGESGYIRFGAMEPAASYRLPSILQTFQGKFPKIGLSIHIDNSKSLGEKVQNDELDLALCTAPELTSNLHFTPLFSEEIGLLLPAAHPLLHNEKIYLKHLEEETILITSAICPFRRNLEKQMIDKGMKPRYRMEINNMLALRHYVQAGYGVAAIPIITVSPPPQGTVLKKIEDFNNRLTVGLMRNQERSYSGSGMNELIQVLIDEKEEG